MELSSRMREVELLSTENDALKTDLRKTREALQETQAVSPVIRQQGRGEGAGSRPTLKLAKMNWCCFCDASHVAYYTYDTCKFPASTLKKAGQIRGQTGGR